MQLGAGGTAGSILGNVTNNGTLLFNRSNEMLLSGVIDGTGQVVQFGAGTTILTGNNTYEGGTTINGGGTLQVGDGGIHGSIQGGVLNHGTLAFKRQDDTSFEGRIRGMGQVEQRGAGTLTLTGENSYEGGTRISAGSIAVGVDTALGAKTGNVILAGGSLILTGNITSGREIMLEDAASAITASTGTTSILNGAISGAGGLTSNGGGTLALSGPNSYTGGTTIRSGTVSVGSDGALGDLAGSVTLDGGTLIFSREVTSARDIKITESGGTISSSVGNWWAGESTLSGEISGVGGLNVSGRGTLALTGNNSYSGGTEITSTVAINNSHALGTGTVSLNGGRLELRAGLNLANDILLTSASGTITANGGTGTLSGVMSGEGGLTADGPGTLILNGENTYRGGTTIRAGTVIIGSDSALGDGTGRVTLDGGRLTFSRAVTSDRSIEITAAGGIIRADTDTTSTLRGSISGRGTLYADGPGTLVLEGENTYERGTVISNGAIAINNDKALGAAASTVLLANGRLELRGNVDSARGIMISGNSGTIRVTEGNTGILDGVISGTGGLTSDGRGTLVLTAENTYNGGTIIAEGSNLQIGNGGNSGSIVGDVTNNGTLTFNRAGPTSFGASISGSGRVAQIGDGTLTLTGDNTYDGGTVITGTVAIDNSNALGTGSVTFDGGRLDLMKSMALANDFVITAASGTIMTNENVTGVLDGAISGEGDLTLIGPALFYLNGQNSYEGGTTIRSATLFIGNDGALGKSDGGVTLNEGVLALARGVASGRDIKLTNWGEIRADSSEVSRFDGTIFGDGLLIATGPGTLTLTGENTYTGGTEVINGAIAINNGNALGTGSVELDNGRLELEDGVTLLNDVNITHASGTIRVAGGSKATLAGPISGEGGITMDGRGTLVLNDGNTYAGGTTIHSGTVSIGNDSALGRSRGDVIVGAGTLAFSSDVTSNRRIELKPGAFIRAGNGTVSTLSGQISGEGALSANGPGTLMLTGENTYAGGTEIINGAVAISDDKALGAATGGVSLDNGRLEFTSRVTTERDIWITPASGTITAREGTSTLNGTISGPGRLITTGPGTLILNGQNDYAGGTTIRSGTVSIAHDSALGDAAGSLAFDQGTLALTGNVDSSRSVYLSGTSGGSATISTQRDTVSTFRGWISGEGGLTSAGPGTLVLTGDNRYEGGTTIAGGTLRLGDGGTRGSIQGDVENHGVLAFNRRDAVLFAGAISGSGAVVQRGSGLTVLTGDHTYTGGTTITDGALQLGDGGTTGSIVGDVSNDGRFIFNRRDTVAFGGTIRGTGQVIQRGAGTTILNAFNTYEGATTVAAGTLIIGDSQHSHAALAGGGGVQVDPGATFGGYGTVTGNVTNQGTIAVANASPGFNDNGSFTVAGSLSNSGLIQIGGKGVGNRLIVLGDYAGDNGVIALNSVLSGDSSTADQIVIQRGLASGSTALRVTNLGGEGGYTSGNGVAVILAQEGARTSEGSFALSAPVVAGPYEYTLYRGSADASAPDNWYLRSARPDGRADYRQEVSVYGTLAPTALMVGRTLVDSLAERTGSPEQAHPDAPAMRDHRLWGRYVGSQGRRSGSGDGIYGDYGARHDYQFNGMQLGGDLLRRQHTDGSRDMAGLTAAMGEAKTTVDHYNGNDAGDGRIKAYSLGAYWTHFGAQDWYLDTGLMITKYRLEGDTHRGLPKMRTDGWGVLANVEGGYPFPLNNQWVLEPQAQLTFQSIDIDSVHDGVADVRFNDVQSLVGRLGVKMGRHWKSESDSDGKAFSVWARLSVLHEAFGRSKTAYSAQEGHVTFNSDIGGSWTQFMLGVSGSATDNMSLYATAAYQETFSGAKADSWNGKVGVRWHW